MAKHHKPKRKKQAARNRQQHKRERKFYARARPRAESYYKTQAKLINQLKPVMVAAKRFKERRENPAPYAETE